MKVSHLFLSFILTLACLFPANRLEAVPQSQQALLTAFVAAALPSYYGAQSNKHLRGAALGALLGYLSSATLFPYADKDQILGATILGAVTGNFFAN